MSKNKKKKVYDYRNGFDESIKSDVNGSYTGTPLDGGEPIQDADDL